MTDKTSTTKKSYRLLGADGEFFKSAKEGTLGGNSSTGNYGKLDCKVALAHLRKGTVYKDFRVFFADEDAAIQAGYRPCAKCMPDRYQIWIQGGTPGTPDYPWKVTPKVKK